MAEPHRNVFQLLSVIFRQHQINKTFTTRIAVELQTFLFVDVSFKKPWDDGTTALKLTPMELMERLVALVPRPRVHLTRYHGVLGPHYKYRKQIVPKPPELKLVQDHEIIEPKQLELKKKNIPWARLLAREYFSFLVKAPILPINLKIIPHLTSHTDDVAADLRSIFYASTKVRAMKHYKEFEERWSKEVPSAFIFLVQNFESALKFYNDPEEEWLSLRITTPLAR